MPNHFHGIVTITDVGGGGDRPVAPTGPGPRSVGAMVAGFKSAAGRRINAIRGTPGASVWQRNYYEHVIRYEAVLDVIRRYIAENPARWAEDPENPARRRPDHRIPWRGMTILRPDVLASRSRRGDRRSPPGRPVAPNISRVRRTGADCRRVSSPPRLGRCSPCAA